MTELELLQMIVDNDTNLVLAIEGLQSILTYIFLTVLFLYFRWEFKGGTFRR